MALSVWSLDGLLTAFLFDFACRALNRCIHFWLEPLWFWGGAENVVVLEWNTFWFYTTFFEPFFKFYFFTYQCKAFYQYICGTYHQWKAFYQSICGKHFSWRFLTRSNVYSEVKFKDTHKKHQNSAQKFKIEVI